MPTLTTNYQLYKPLVADAVDEDLWGGYLNDDMDSIDSLLKTGIAYVKRTVTLDDFITTSDSKKFILADASAGNIILTLPTAATATDGFTIAVKNIGVSGTVTLDGNGSETIDGQTTLVLSSQYDAIILVSDGVNKWNTQSRSQRSGLTTRAYYASGSGNFSIPSGISKVRTIVSAGGGAGGNGGNASGGSSNHAPDGSDSTVTYSAVTITAGGGKGGYNSAIPGDIYNGYPQGTATGGDLNIAGGGSVGGSNSIYEGNHSYFGTNGGLVIKDWTVTPGGTMAYSVGAGGAGVVFNTVKGADGSSGYIIFEY